MMSVEVPLTRGMFALVDEADLHLITGYRWRAHGSGSSIYARADIVVDGRQTTVAMHNVILTPPIGFEVDHHNHDTLDNRRSNIRLCTHRQNSANRRYSRSRPGYRGVYARDGGLWRAAIMLNGRQHSLGFFDDEIKAAVAYDQAAIKHNGEFAKLNFPLNRDWILPEPTARPRSGMIQPKRA